MSNNKTPKTRLLFCILTGICILTAIALIVTAAYFAQGEFKDVFVNKKDYFSADVLYGISSVEGKKLSVGSSGTERKINIYNYDVSTGDFNAFDVEFDVYVWLSAVLPAGKTYVLSYGGNEISFTNQTDPTPVLKKLKLKGGERSTVTLTAGFDIQDGEDLTEAPGLYVVAVPTSPERLNSVYLGALIRPTRSDAFNVESDFDHAGDVDRYAAFTYRVNTVGTAPEGDKICIKWKSDALTLIRVNGKATDTVTIDTGNYENGFDRMIEWNAQSDQSDYFVFFRNTENDMWNKENLTWDRLRDQIVTEYINNTQE